MRNAQSTRGSKQLYTSMRKAPCTHCRGPQRVSCRPATVLLPCLTSHGLENASPVNNSKPPTMQVGSLFSCCAHEMAIKNDFICPLETPSLPAQCNPCLCPQASTGRCHMHHEESQNNTQFQPLVEQCDRLQSHLAGCVCVGGGGGGIPCVDSSVLCRSDARQP